ncbi:MAG: hypothetical protein WC836_23720 [Desulfobacula sp.]|jgi:hypothetical protein
MSQTKKYIKRSILDRRTNKDRRTLNLGPLFPGKEQRITINRRQRFEDRFGWQPLSLLGSFPNAFKEIFVTKDSPNRNERRA